MNCIKQFESFNYFRNKNFKLSFFFLLSAIHFVLVLFSNLIYFIVNRDKEEDKTVLLCIFFKSQKRKNKGKINFLVKNKYKS